MNEDLKTGDVVFLPSRPDVRMTVRTVEEYVKCVWFDEKMELREGTFKRDMLRKWS